MTTRGSLSKRRRYPDSARVTSPHLRGTMRMVAVLVALEAPASLEEGREQKVAQAHTVARRLTHLGLRLTTDGDRYYLTHPAPDQPPPSPVLAILEGPPSRGANETLLVVGRANDLDELADLVNRLSADG